MVVNNPNNWHWVEKNCLPWSKEYLNENLASIVFENDDFKFEFTSVDSVDGDCNVSQRKGKVLCIYDMSLQFSVNGVHKKEEDDSVKATVSVPEFVHDQEEDEYVFEVTSERLQSEVRKYFVPVLKKKLLRFQDDLIKAHSRDVQESVA